MTAEDRKSVVNACASFPEVQQVTLFGSRALGTHKPGSDVDLAVHGQDVTDDTVTQVRAALSELPLVPYFFDIVHYDSITAPALKEHIDTYGVPLYHRT